MKVMKTGNVFEVGNKCRDIFLWKCIEAIHEKRMNFFQNVLRIKVYRCWALFHWVWFGEITKYMGVFSLETFLR